MKRLLSILILALALPLLADNIFIQTMKTHYVSMTTVPVSPTALYSSNVWLQSIELIPQSSSSPTCTIQDGAGNIAYNVIALSPNHSYRDERDKDSPLFMSGGITWSCSDTSVKAQVMVQY